MALVDVGQQIRIIRKMELELVCIRKLLEARPGGDNEGDV